MLRKYHHLLTALLLALFPAMLSAQAPAAAVTAAPADTSVTQKQPQHRSANKSRHKTVAIISSFSQDSPWSNDYIPPVAMAVSSTPNVSCEIFYLNSVLVNDTTKYYQVMDNMFNNFKDNKPDYVVMIGKMAFCMRDEMKKEWGDIPMLMIANSASMAPMPYYISGEMVEDEALSVKVQKLSDLQKEYNFTAIVAPYFVKETLELMMSTMHHDISDVVFVSVPIYLERNNSLRIAEYLAENYPGINYRWLTASTDNVEQLRSLIAEPHPGTGILMASWTVQTDGPFGYPLLSNQETKMMSSSVNPVFILSSSLIDNGAAGGAFCNKQEVEAQIVNRVDSMLHGKKMSDMPIWECTEYEEVINYNTAEKYGLCLKNLGDNVQIIGRTRSFWEKYHWETIIGAIVATLLVFVFWKRSQMQAREIRTLQLHRKFISSMPIAYGHVTLYLSADGRHVNNVVYSNVNDAMQEVINKNGCRTGEYVLFPIDFMNEKAKELFEKGHKIDFLHHFDKTDTYYEMFVDYSDRESASKQPNVKELDIFAVDVTNRVAMEKDLKEVMRKLDLTINVAGIIPWEWDIKTDVMRFDAYSLFGRQLHDVEDPQGESPATYLDVYSEFMPLIHPDDKDKLEVIRKALLVKSQSSFKVRYRLKLAVDNQNFYQWVEVRGHLTALDSKENPAVCAGAMWLIDDDIVNDPIC